MGNAWTKVLTTLVTLFVTWAMGALSSHLSKETWTAVNDIIMQVGGPAALTISIVGVLATALAALWARLQNHANFKTALELGKEIGKFTPEDVKANAPGPLSALANPKAVN